MGKMIEKLALDGQHEIVYKTSGKIDPAPLQKADVAIEFSVPEAAFHNLSTCMEYGIPVVSGTTGWLDQFDQITEICQRKKGSFLYASNFSIGVNLFFELNRKLAKMMKNLPEYQVDVQEIHHLQKKDKPSGTAISLAEGIISEGYPTDWELVESQKDFPDTVIPIEAKRLEDVKGTHIITYKSAVDSIEIKHTAHSREGFAKGAIMAADYIKDKTGIFTMKDVLKELF